MNIETHRQWQRLFRFQYQSLFATFFHQANSSHLLRSNPTWIQGDLNVRRYRCQPIFKVDFIRSTISHHWSCHKCNVFLRAFEPRSRKALRMVGIRYSDTHEALLSERNSPKCCWSKNMKILCRLVTFITDEVERDQVPCSQNLVSLDSVHNSG
jgi:hypothetical protein